MKVHIEWEDGASFTGKTEGGHALTMDGPPEAGGRNRGPRPMETVLLGTGACGGFHVVQILKKARQDVTRCTMEIEADRSPACPQVFTRIHIRYRVTGRNLKREWVRRAIDLSTERYCSASIMLGKTANVSADFEIEEEMAPAPQP